MPKLKSNPFIKPVQVIPAGELEQIRKEALVTGPLAKMAHELNIVDATTFSTADVILDNIVKIRAAISSRFEHILKPLNAARESIHKLRRELDGPPSDAEALIRGKMRAYKLQEQKALTTMLQKEALRQEELQQQANALLQKEQVAKTPQLRNRIAQQRVEVESKMAQTNTMPEPVHVAGSTTRPVKKVRITNIHNLLNGIHNSLGASYMPVEETDKLREYLEAMVNRIYKSSGYVFPGTEQYEDVTIVKR